MKGIRRSPSSRPMSASSREKSGGWGESIHRARDGAIGREIVLPVRAQSRVEEPRMGPQRGEATQGALRRIGLTGLPVIPCLEAAEHRRGIEHDGNIVPVQVYFAEWAILKSQFATSRSGSPREAAAPGARRRGPGAAGGPLAGEGGGRDEAAYLHAGGRRDDSDKARGSPAGAAPAAPR